MILTPEDKIHKPKLVFEKVVLFSLLVFSEGRDEMVEMFRQRIAQAMALAGGLLGFHPKLLISYLFVMEV
ncbi:hypothetical protein Csa_005067 [Cucumis sativus]|uniref:Uncharacterized protein n=1 Tax=Cucumis sativus TaxID=3659 RepID=A0A0A0KB49_CUCSA|nr:hypothetical protein Csa_005067 [Cucumis sativus]